MKGAVRLYVLSILLAGQVTPREAIFAGAVTLGGQVVPLFANGYLIYLHQPNRLQVFGPDTQLAYEYDVPCPPQTSNCSVSGVAISREGIAALGIGYAITNGFTSGIRMLDKTGKELRFIHTGGYVPRQLTFDIQGDLWSIGWQRDRWNNGTESKDDYNIVRKYSPDGTLRGEFLPRSLWVTKHGPALGGRGYWTMYAADDRMGAIFNENFSGATPEWVDWDLNGLAIRRVPLKEAQHLISRAFNGKGKLYAQFRTDSRAAPTELRVLDTGTGEWLPVRANLPEQISAFLLGAEGDQLVYRVNRGGNVRLIWARPE
jgi:hypothetical protein